MGDETIILSETGERPVTECDAEVVELRQNVLNLQNCNIAHCLSVNSDIQVNGSKTTSES